MSSFAIKELTDQQREALWDVQVGDFIWLEVRVRHADDWHDGVNSENSEDAGEGAVSEISGTGQHPYTIDDVRDTDHNERNDAASVPENPRGREEALPSTTSYAGPQDSSENAATNGEDPSQEEVEFDAASNDTSAGDSAKEEQTFRSRGGLFFVNKLARNSDESVDDVDLIELRYVKHPGEDEKNDEHGFQIYGTQLRLTSPTHRTHGSGCTHGLSMRTFVQNAAWPRIEIHRNPGGDFIRDRLFSYECPGHCENGWLSSLSQIAQLVPEYTSPATMGHRIVCPVCMGLDLLKEQQVLRAQLEAVSWVDFTAVTDFYTRLTPRRYHVGHEFRHFDERDWGYYFDDMPSEDEVDDEILDTGDYNDAWAYWSEAMDPNNHMHARYHPASQATIAALPRKRLADVLAASKTELLCKMKNAGPDATTTDTNESDESSELYRCLICMETLTADQVVVELPCTHFFCATGCIQQWLQLSERCPICRTAISAVDGDDGVKGTPEDRTERTPMLGDESPNEDEDKNGDFEDMFDFTQASLAGDGEEVETDGDEAVTSGMFDFTQASLAEDDEEVEKEGE